MIIPLLTFSVNHWFRQGDLRLIETLRRRLIFQAERRGDGPPAEVQLQEQERLQADIEEI